MNILVTGSAGFIGYHLTVALLKQGHEVLGIDNINDYYDVNLKYSRLKECGIVQSEIDWNTVTLSKTYANYTFIRLTLEDKDELLKICHEFHFDIVINLAAQAGVRYSLENPDAYIKANLVGFNNVLEACRLTMVNHLIYASSSSVYGLNQKVPFSITDRVDHPASLYAATKKANELMAHAYSHIYRLQTTGLRFFTVYGPWGRPDMACYVFADAISNDEPIQVFNNGNMKRDFTYIDDVVEGIVKIMESPVYRIKSWSGKQPDPSTSSAPYNVYNLGNNSPVNLLDFITELENSLGKKAQLEMKGMQPGDVESTWADIDETTIFFNYNPQTSIQTGLQKFSDWYKNYHAFSPAISPGKFVGQTRIVQFNTNTESNSASL